jgi:predicted nucleic acid-binding protein
MRSVLSISVQNLKQESLCQLEEGKLVTNHATPILIDSSLLLEIVLNTGQWSRTVENFIDLIKEKQVKLYATSLAIEGLCFYMNIRDTQTVEDVLIWVEQTLNLRVLNVTDRVVDEALALEWENVDAAVEMLVAANHELSVLVSLQPQHYQGSNLRVVSVEELRPLANWIIDISGVDDSRYEKGAVCSIHFASDYFSDFFWDGESGSDFFWGEGGNDFFWGGYGNDFLDGEEEDGATILHSGDANYGDCMPISLSDLFSDLFGHHFRPQQFSESKQSKSLENSPIYPFGSHTSAMLIDRAIQEVESTLTRFATAPDRDVAIAIAFGEGANLEVASSLFKGWAVSDFGNLPKVEIRLGSELNNANGAFSSDTQTIYLSSDFLTRNAGNIDQITGVLLEEIGHAIDFRINQYDAAGDEGDIFSRLVRGEQISAGELLALKTENDHALIKLDGSSVAIEMSQIQMAEVGGKLYQTHRGTDNGIYIAYSNNGRDWSSWEKLPGVTENAPAIMNFRGTAYLAHRGLDDRIYFASYADAKAGKWQALSNGNAKTLDAPAMLEYRGRLYVAYRGEDNSTYLAATDGNRSNWCQLDGQTSDAITIFRDKLYKRERWASFGYFSYFGTENASFSSTDSQTWDTWQKQGGTTPSAPIEVPFINISIGRGLADLTPTSYLVDFSLLLELFYNRAHHASAVGRFIELVQNDRTKLYVTHLAVERLRFYLGRKDPQIAEDALIWLEQTLNVRVLDITDAIFDEGLAMEWDSIDNAVELLAAARHDVDALVSLYPKHYPDCNFPVLAVGDLKFFRTTNTTPSANQNNTSIVHNQTPSVETMDNDKQQQSQSRLNSLPFFQYYRGWLIRAISQANAWSFEVMKSGTPQSSELMLASNRTYPTAANALLQARRFVMSTTVNQSVLELLREMCDEKRIHPEEYESVSNDLEKYRLLLISHIDSSEFSLSIDNFMDIQK